MKLAEIKAKLKQNAPVILIAGFSFAGGISMVLAGVYRQRLNRYLDADDLDSWTTIEISKAMMTDILDGATLKYRMYSTEPNRFFVQSTTASDFPDEANEKFNAAVSAY